MTRGQRKRAERRSEIIDNLCEWACAASIVIFGYINVIAIIALMG